MVKQSARGPARGAVGTTDGEGKSRRYDPSETRARILNAAYQLFGSRGYAGTGTADIAALANVSEGSIFYHFGAKKSLLGELGRLHAQKLVIAMQEMDSLDSLPLTVSLERCFKFCEAHNVWQEIEIEGDPSQKVMASKNAEVEPFYEAAKASLVVWTKAHLDALMMHHNGPRYDTALVARLVCAAVGEALQQYFEPDITPEQRAHIRAECIRFCVAATALSPDPAT